MQIEIGKWGNSAAMRIPAELLRATGLEVGSKMDIQMKDGSIVLTPLRKKMSRKERLEWLLADLDTYGPDKEIDWGPDVGNEIVEW